VEGEARGAAAPETRGLLGIVGGSAFLEALELSGAEVREVATDRGSVTVRLGREFVFLRRHGEDVYRPPHRIPHHAHVLAFEALGVSRAAGLASAGSLDPELGPGDVVIPDDYLSCHPPPTFAGDEYLHIVPELDADVRGRLLAAAHAATAAEPEPPRVVDGGVYAETSGPRFETRAEIRRLARSANLVGMTAASEATLFQERGIGYAVLAVVDNWAHGLGPDPLGVEAFRARQAENAPLARRILDALIEGWRMPA
jgi:5'-methylthioadenosine phosphorylase